MPFSRHGDGERQQSRPQGNGRSREDRLQKVIAELGDISRQKEIDEGSHTDGMTVGCDAEQKRHAAERHDDPSDADFYGDLSHPSGVMILPRNKPQRNRNAHNIRKSHDRRFNGGHDFSGLWDGSTDGVPFFCSLPHHSDLPGAAEQNFVILLSAIHNPDSAKSPGATALKAGILHGTFLILPEFGAGSSLTSGRHRC